MFSVLDHTNINFKELETILLSVTDKQNCIFPLHCSPVFIGDSFFTKSPINRGTISHEHEDDLRMDISKLKLPVHSFQTSIEDVSFSKDDLNGIPDHLPILPVVPVVPVTNDSLSVENSHLIPPPTLCVVEKSTIEQNQRYVSSLFHSITLDGTDSQLSNNQGSMSSPGSVCTSRRSSHCETGLLPITEDSFTSCAENGIVVRNRVRIHSKSFIFRCERNIVFLMILMMMMMI